MNCLPSRRGRCCNARDGDVQDDSVAAARSDTSGLSNTVADQSTGASQVAIVSQAHLLDNGDAYQLSRLHSYVTAPSPTLSSVLPAFTNTVSPKFVWGESYDREFINSINEAYDTIVGWRGNLFLTPSGTAGKAFVVETVRLIRCYAEKSSLEVIALRAVFVMQALLLQKPHVRPKARDHVLHLTRRLELWKIGNISTLLREGIAIQRQLEKSISPMTDARIAHIFAKLMMEGKTKSALRFVSEHSKGGVLSLAEIQSSNNETLTVRDVLRKKHPAPIPIAQNSLLYGPIDDVDAILFDGIDATAIRAAALRTTGAAGPSGMDAVGWRCLCASFNAASNDLCEAMDSLAKRLCTEFVGIDAFVACRLIPLDNVPGSDLLVLERFLAASSRKQ